MTLYSQYLIYDRGGTDLEIHLSLSTNPLRHEPYPPHKTLEWSTDLCDYRAFYWVKRDTVELSDDEIKALCQRGYTHLR